MTRKQLALFGGFPAATASPFDCFTAPLSLLQSALAIALVKRGPVGHDGVRKCSIALSECAGRRLRGLHGEQELNGGFDVVCALGQRKGGDVAVKAHLSQSLQLAHGLSRFLFLLTLIIDGTSTYTLCVANTSATTYGGDGDAHSDRFLRFLAREPVLHQFRDLRLSCLVIVAIADMLYHHCLQNAVDVGHALPVGLRVLPLEPPSIRRAGESRHKQQGQRRAAAGELLGDLGVVQVTELEIGRTRAEIAQDLAQQFDRLASLRCSVHNRSVGLFGHRDGALAQRLLTGLRREHPHVERNHPPSRVTCSENAY